MSSSNVAIVTNTNNSNCVTKQDASAATATTAAAKKITIIKEESENTHRDLVKFSSTLCISSSHIHAFLATTPRNATQAISLKH